MSSHKEAMLKVEDRMWLTKHSRAEDISGSLPMSHYFTFMRIYRNFNPEHTAEEYEEAGHLADKSAKSLRDMIWLKLKGVV